MLKEHPDLVKAKAKLTTELAKANEMVKSLRSAKEAAETKAQGAVLELAALRASAAKDIENAVLRTKLQGGLLMLQRAEASSVGTGAAAPGGDVTPGVGVAGGSGPRPTPSALEQFFAQA